MIIIIITISFCRESLRPKRSSRFAKRASTIRYGDRNLELIHECFPKHLGMGTAIIKKDKETEEEGKKRGVNICKYVKCSRKQNSHRPNAWAYRPHGVATPRSSG